jgi:hypothetical protein
LVTAEPDLTGGDALDSAATQAGFGPAMRALFQFPTVVDMLCQQIDWTRQVGSAFTSDQKAVLDAVQRLRTQAAAAGNLKSTPEQTVEKKSEGDKVIVEVKPADPKVVYVPQYDPQAVYAPAPAQPAPATTTTPATTESTVSTSSAVAGGILAFGVGVILGKALEDDDDYCYPNWGAGGVYYGSRPFYPPAYVYRPAYGPGMHPSYRYTSPPGYRHAYNNVNVNRNVVVNNNNYFNRFANNQNLRVNPQQRNVSRAGNESWKGQSTYAGTRDARPGERSNAAAARGGSDEQRSRAESVDRGYGGSTRNGTTRGTSELRGDVTRSDARESRDVAASRDTNRAPDRHTAPADVAARERTASTSAAAREDALAGANRRDDASFDRSASARGRASTGGRELSGGQRR